MLPLFLFAANEDVVSITRYIIQGKCFYLKLSRKQPSLRQAPFSCLTAFPSQFVSRDGRCLVALEPACTPGLYLIPDRQLPPLPIGKHHYSSNCQYCLSVGPPWLLLGL
jgi:hypothetical protein